MSSRVAAALILRSWRVDAPPTMTSRTALIKQLIADGTYPIDEVAIAESILVRAKARSIVPDLALRCATTHLPSIRSFRPHSGARSFRLVRAERRTLEQPRSPELARLTAS